MANQTARLFLCACCRIQVLVCSQCDRGQRYCADGCAAATRRALQRDSARRYQCGRAGRFKHALRTQRWRARQAALAKIVTHQGSQAGPSDDVLPATQTSALAANMAANGLMQLLSTPSPQDRWGDRTGITLRPCRR